MVVISKGDGTDGEPEGPPELIINGLLQNFKLERKADELKDDKFPPTLHAAAQLFAMAGMASQAKQLVKDTDNFLALFKEGPDGVSQHRIGRGCVCFACGHCGIPSNPDESMAERGYGAVMPKCYSCGDDVQTNFIEIEQPDGTKIPWIEAAATTEEGEKHAARLATVAAGAEKKADVAADAQKPKKLSAKPNEPCPCGAGKKFKKCCGAPR